MGFADVWCLAPLAFRSENISDMASVRSALTPGCLARSFLKPTGRQSRGSQLRLAVWKHVGVPNSLALVASSVKKRRSNFIPAK